MKLENSSLRHSTIRIGCIDAKKAEDRVGSYDAADCLRYLVAMKARAVTQKNLRRW